jgi:chromosome segregation ATPase
MSRPGVSYEEVSKVAGALLSQGMHPSVQRVRNKLGTGSNTTIDRHLKNWQETFKREKLTVLPETVPEELMTPIESFWQTAMTHAEKSYQELKRDFQKQVEEAESAKAATLLLLEEQNAANQKLEMHLSNTRTENDSLKASLQHLEGEYKAHQDHVVEIKEQADQSVQLAKSSIQDYQRQVETLENALATQKETEAKRVTELEARIQDERKRGEVAESRLLVDIDTLRQMVKQKDTAIITLEKESKVLSHQIQELKTELKVQQMNHEKFEKESSNEISMDREALAQGEKRETYLQKQLNDVTGLFEKMQQTLNEAHNREMVLAQQVTKLEIGQHIERL